MDLARAVALWIFNAKKRCEITSDSTNMNKNVAYLCFFSAKLFLELTTVILKANRLISAWSTRLRLKILQDVVAGTTVNVMSVKENDLSLYHVLKARAT